jgi:hypothetical protein
MVKLKLVPILVIGVSLLIASSAFAYSHYIIQKNEKKIVKSLKVTTTPTIIPTPTPSSSPSASPTSTIKYIQYPTSTPTPDIKQVLNDYDACKKACPFVGEGVTCTENSDNIDQPPTTDCHTVEEPGSNGSKTTVKCTSSSGSSNGKTTCQSNRHPDETCINSCKGKYGLNF